MTAAARQFRGWRLASPLTANVLAAVTVALLAGLFVDGALTGGVTAGKLASVAGLLAIEVAVTAVGLVVARHQPGNPIGWLLLGTSAWVALSLVSGAYDTYVYHGHHPGLPVLAPVALLLGQQFLDLLIPFPLMILLFPDGRLPSRRWRWAVAAYLAVAGSAVLTVTAVAASLLASHQAVVLADGDLAQLDNPSGGTAFLGTVSAVYLLTVAGFWLCVVIRQLASWRRSSGERRQQLKWLAAGATVCGALGISAIIATSAIWEVLIAGFAALPLSIGVGILKYRLYDVDRIISRTLAYAIVTGLLAGLYAGLVLLATRVLPFTTPVAVAAATLAAAAAFNPLRRRTQHLVDRRFNRARYHADTATTAFAARLQSTTDLAAVHTDLLATVQQTLEPAHAAVWLAGVQR